MKAAFIVMSILGCDDSGVQCQPVGIRRTRMARRSLPATQLPSANSTKFKNVNFPMVVAVCQTADTTALADSETDLTENDPTQAALPPTPPAVVKAEGHGITARAIALVEYALPSRKTLKSAIITKPVHFVSDTYSWVARKIVY
jgi:hypothetical protein